MVNNDNLVGNVQLRTMKGNLRLSATAVFFAVCVLLVPNFAQAKYASYVIDAETGAVLHQTNAETRNYPASLTKMMTLYMVFDALEKGSIRLDQTLNISARAARQPSSKLGLSKGDTLTYEQAILAIVTKSANDVATAIGENLGGTERKFALSMTARARSIGMDRTTFRNASGLPHRGQLSTAKDMAVLALRLLKDFPQYYQYFSTQSFSYDGTVHKNHNALLKTYKGTDGIKTGYIRASGFNLVASVERDGKRLIGVVFGGRTSGARDKHMAKLLNRSYAKLDISESVVVSKTETPSKTAKTTKASALAKLQWGIQVGAYKTTEPAYEIAQIAIDKAPDLLFDGQIRVVPLKNGVNSPVYRARILGLSKHQAYQACKVLKRRNINCMELRMKAPLQQLAAAD